MSAVSGWSASGWRVWRHPTPSWCHVLVIMQLEFQQSFLFVVLLPQIQFKIRVRDSPVACRESTHSVKLCTTRESPQCSSSVRLWTRPSCATTGADSPDSAKYVELPQMQFLTVVDIPVVAQRQIPWSANTEKTVVFSTCAALAWMLTFLHSCSGACAMLGSTVDAVMGRIFYVELYSVPEVDFVLLSYGCGRARRRQQQWYVLAGVAVLQVTLLLVLCSLSAQSMLHLRYLP